MATATVKDIKETAKIVEESIKAGRGAGKFSERVENILLTYSNVYRNGLDCIIRLRNGNYESIYTYIK